jgi:hypothetical protein
VTNRFLGRRVQCFLCMRGQNVDSCSKKNNPTSVDTDGKAESESKDGGRQRRQDRSRPPHRWRPKLSGKVGVHLQTWVFHLVISSVGVQGFALRRLRIARCDDRVARAQRHCCLRTAERALWQPFVDAVKFGHAHDIAVLVQNAKSIVCHPQRPSSEIVAQTGTADHGAPNEVSFTDSC